MTSLKTRKNRAPLNLAMGIVGLAALVTITVSTAMEMPVAVTSIGILVFFISLITMFFTRNSDEYTAQLWVSAANAAFIVMVLWLFLGPFIAGIVEGYNAAHEGRDANEAPIYALVVAGSGVSLFAFFLTFNIKRLTGAL